MKLLNFGFIFMVNATQWQPLSEIPYHMTHMGHNHVGKAYFGKAFAIGNEEKKNSKVVKVRTNYGSDTKMAYTVLVTAI